MGAEGNLEKKAEELEKELRWLERKFRRSGVDPQLGMRTLLRMQKRTHDFLIWFVKSYVEEAKKSEEST